MYEVEPGVDVDEVIRRVREEARACALAPSVGEGAPLEALWGELRALVHHTASGLEPVEEWVHLVARFPVGERRKALDYLQRQWACQPALAGLECLEEELRFRNICARLNAFAERGVRFFGQPLEQEWLEAQEGEHGVSLPAMLRRFVLQVGGGIGAVDERQCFDFLDEDDERQAPPFLRNFATWFLEQLQVKQEPYADVLVHVVRHHLFARLEPGTRRIPRFAFQPAGERLEQEGLVVGEEERSWLQGAILLEVYVDGQHDNHIVILFARGPLQGLCLKWYEFLFLPAYGNVVEVFSLVDWLEEQLRWWGDEGHRGG